MCLEATTQGPDGPAVLLKVVGQLRDEGVRVAHRQQDARTTSDTLLGAPISRQVLKVSGLFGRQVDESRGASPHQP